MRHDKQNLIGLEQFDLKNKKIHSRSVTTRRLDKETRRDLKKLLKTFNLKKLPEIKVLYLLSDLVWKIERGLEFCVEAILSELGYEPKWYNYYYYY